MRCFFVFQNFSFEKLDKRADDFRSADHFHETHVDQPVARHRRRADFNAAADLRTVARHRQKRAMFFAFSLAFDDDIVSFEMQDALNQATHVFKSAVNFLRFIVAFQHVYVDAQPAYVHAANAAHVKIIHISRRAVQNNFRSLFGV